MRILVSGASGLIGSAFIPLLIERGDEVVRLVRTEKPTGPSEIYWNPAKGELNLEQVENFDAIVNLSGENVAEGRWTSEKKSRIVKSRTLTTELLATTVSKLDHPPTVFISASATGYYGNRGSEVLNESAAPGHDFLSGVCVKWEAAAKPLDGSGVRLIFARFGAVLSRQGGALAKLLTPFRAGFGGRIGDGRQYMSWIAIDDATRALMHCIDYPGIVGPVNIVSPEPVRNSEFTDTLASVLSRPALLPVPAFVLRMIFGEMADAVLLSSTRAVPEKLVSSKFEFRYPGLGQALEHLSRE